MTHTDAMVLNDSEGLFQSPKRHDMTGALTYVLLSPHADIAALEQQFSKRNYSYTMYNQAYSVVANYIGDRSQKKRRFCPGVGDRNSRYINTAGRTCQFLPFSYRFFSQSH